MERNDVETGSGAAPASIDRRQFVLRGAALGVMLTGSSTVLGACGGGTALTKATDAITIGADTPTSLDPAFAQYYTDLMAINAAYEGLIGYKPGTYEIVNQLAETFEPSPDGTSFHFTLKQGVQFHGGYGELTTSDVKFSFERIAGMTKPVLQSAYVADWAPQLKEVQITSKYEGTIVLHAPFAPLMRTTLPALSGLVVSRKAVLERGKEFASHPIGSGPYQVQSFTPNRQVVLKRFAQWSAASKAAVEPAYDTITITANGDPTFVDAGLRSGDLDVALLEGSQLRRLGADDSLSVAKFTSLSYDWIGMNVTDPSLRDIDVRKAIRLAIDVPAIIEVAYHGASPRATAVLPPTMDIGYWKDAPVYNRDVAAAKSLMAGAQVSSRDLTLTVSNSPSYFKTIAELVQANLADIGIKVSIDLQDPATFYAPSAAALKKMQLFGLDFASFPDPFWSMQWFTTAQIGAGGYNWMSWSSPEFDQLNDQAARELDDAKRTELYIEMQRIWDENANAVWLAWPATIWSADKDVAMTIRPDGLPAVQAFHAA
jgi:peptide/nickel transport system substrate-binding protein